MKFCDASKPLYLETDAFGVGLGFSLPQLRDCMNCGQDEISDNTALYTIAFASKTLSSTEWQYRRKALGILHGLEKFYHYCFAKEVYVITDHKP